MIGQGDANHLADLVSAHRDASLYSVKETCYFPAYVDIFSHLRGSRCTFVEVGVLGGGSLQMWRTWLGPEARIIGVDLNPDSKRLESLGFEIYVGDQGDPHFWVNFFNEVGEFDALLDDGGHQYFQQIRTVEAALIAASDSSVVAVEDTVSSFMRDFKAIGRPTFLDYATAATDLLTARFFAQPQPGRFPAIRNVESAKQFSRVASIEFFPGLVAFKLRPTALDPVDRVRNTNRPAVVDYRYKGSRGGTFLWPDFKRRRRRRVSGGRSFREALRIGPKALFRRIRNSGTVNGAAR